MNTIAAISILLLMLATGWVLFRRLARALLARDEVPSDSELVLLGILPALALVGMIGTYLAMAGLFYSWAASALCAAVLLGLRHDSYALLQALKDAGLQGWRALRRGNLFALLALLMSALFLWAGISLSQMPSDNVDVWAIHLPLAQALIAHHGYAANLTGSLFYDSQPLFLELLFAIPMFASDYIAADMVNLAIYFGLLLLLASFPRRARFAQFLLIFALFFWAQNFLAGATEPMTDLPRSCFSAGAFLFAYRYALGFRRFDLAVCGLLAGAAVAGKYTELLTPAIIAVTLLPLILRKGTWRDLGLAVTAFIFVAAPWYLKNWIAFGNPIFPFVFGHPGLSDQWMADYMLDVGRPFAIADRAYSTNLLTLHGWRNFAAVLARDSSSLVLGVLAVLGLLLPRPRRWLLPLWAGLLLVIWYGFFFNGTRWAITAHLLLSAAFLLNLFWLADYGLDEFNPRRACGFLERIPGLTVITPRLKTDRALWAAITSCVVALGVVLGTIRLATNHSRFLLPRWMAPDLAAVVMHPGRMDRWLEENRRGYVMYRFIAERDYSWVLQPFDNGGFFYASAYNDGKPNRWVLADSVLPPDLTITHEFTRANNIRFFIVPDMLTPLDVERLGAARVASAQAVIAILKPYSHLVFHDNKAWALYHIDN